ncbi:uncharacterized protein LY89DRAFT_353588 [Mollisia scopiformis]|uniref:Uncharacterized protein n=1 Tax=Mollisia scopiformis TaxID=149040 RepID=A0A132B620_MOLSC|nr:uncharacterized protein LY89DRAFT_353588 [Mollisia scopiformis]KUJ07858.1 hypothetical protein LY89DRAFT_353588 [Mollisia scopiformis]
MFFRSELFTLTLFLLSHIFTTASDLNNMGTIADVPTVSALLSSATTRSTNHLRRATPSFEPFLWKSSPNRIALTLAPLNSSTPMSQNPGPTWDPIPNSVLQSRGVCPVGDSTAPTGTAFPPAIVTGIQSSDGTKNEASSKVAATVAAGMVVAWFAVRVLLNGIVDVPVVHLEGLEL